MFEIDIPHINLGLLTSIVAAADPKSSCYVGYICHMVRGWYAPFETATSVLCMCVNLRLPIGLLPLQEREQRSPRAMETDILRQASWTGPCVRQMLWSIFGNVLGRTYPLGALCYWHLQPSKKLDSHAKSPHCSSGSRRSTMYRQKSRTSVAERIAAARWLSKLFPRLAHQRIVSMSDIFPTSSSQSRSRTLLRQQELQEV